MSVKPKGVVVVGPAWHSCGSYQVFRAQIAAYRHMGLQTYFLALAPSSETLGEAGGFWDYYLRMTPDLDADQRGEAKLAPTVHKQPAMLLDKLMSISRTPSYYRTLLAKHAMFPHSLAEFLRANDIRLIHCNHFFNLPAAERVRNLAGRARILCDTHDVQSRHFMDSDPKHPVTGKAGTFEAYFQDELRCFAGADDLIHLNDQEFRQFSAALPAKRHHLIYPSVARPKAIKGMKEDIDFLIVSSANNPNYASLCWFLENVWNDDLNARAKLCIIGNIDYMFDTKSNPLLKRYGDIFASRVEDVAEWYARAKTVVAPVTEGQGIAIKTIEALSYAKPFLFSPLALRGFDKDPLAAKLPGLCKTADDFRHALNMRLKQKKTVENREAAAIYESLFAPEVYNAKLKELALS
jgi:polysaccharide biosynthesis protein PslH